MIVLEHGIVGFKLYEGSVLFRRLPNPLIVCENSFFELGKLSLSIAKRLHFEIIRKRIDSFRTHTIQTNWLLECTRIVLCSGVDLWNYIHNFSEGNSPAIIAHHHTRIGDGHIDHFSIAHHVFIDGVIDHLFYEHINAIILWRSIAKFSDVHPGT